jgi:predicted DsbA family dithiol-disulfide isomerase
MCPWCVIGYKQLSTALETLDGEIAAEVRWHPFELNPDLPIEGEDRTAHILRKFGRMPDEGMTSRVVTTAAAAGYEMRYLGEGEEPPRWLWNTFRAHKLLRWALEAHGPAAQTRLKLALFDAHFQQSANVSDLAVLLDLVASVGLDREGAEAALADEALGEIVRAEEAEARRMEITGVPAMVVNGRYLVPGAQGPETYTDVLRRIVAESV